MSCAPSTVNGPTTVWTAKSTSIEVFFGMAGIVGTNGIAFVRTSLQMATSSGLLTVKPAYRTSNDKLTWGTPVAIGSQSLAANGSVLGDSYTDISTAMAAKLFVEFGVIAFNTSGTQVEIGTLGLALDLKGA